MLFILSPVTVVIKYSYTYVSFPFLMVGSFAGTKFKSGEESFMKKTPVTVFYTE